MIKSLSLIQCGVLTDESLFILNSYYKIYLNSYKIMIDVKSK